MYHTRTSDGETSHRHHHGFKPSVRRGFDCWLWPGGLPGGCTTMGGIGPCMLCPRARGFRGESMGPVLEGGLASVLSPLPVTFRRIGGLVPDEVVGANPDPLPPAVGVVTVLGANFSPLSGENVSSAPIVCLRAFSCLLCNALKWVRSSCHLISSRPSFDRVVEMFPTDL